ncbi:hypothetical protein HYQ46_004736 [Verticillium longisporum]|nr:hypothetical protein HYQ46_004736 [Verticillium longisporum]
MAMITAGWRAVLEWYLTAIAGDCEVHWCHVGDLAVCRPLGDEEPPKIAARRMRLASAAGMANMQDAEGGGGNAVYLANGLIMANHNDQPFK